jgi:hypothetical protein
LFFPLRNRNFIKKRALTMSQGDASPADRKERPRDRAAEGPMVGRGNYMMLLVQSAERILRFHSNREEINRFIVEIVIRNVDKMH